MIHGNGLFVSDSIDYGRDRLCLREIETQNQWRRYDAPSTKVRAVPGHIELTINAIDATHFQHVGVRPTSWHR